MRKSSRRLIQRQEPDQAKSQKPFFSAGNQHHDNQGGAPFFNVQNKPEDKTLNSVKRKPEEEEKVQKSNNEELKPFRKKIEDEDKVQKKDAEKNV